MKISTKSIIIALTVIIVLILLFISMADSESVNTVTKNFLEYFNLIVTPICLILGIIIGYPLVKRKLVEDYVSRQFEIMHEANRVLRKECLEMMNKYPQKWISNQLKKEDIDTCVSDISNLSHLAFDANPDAHRYAKLVEKSLRGFYQRYPENGSHHYYRESLHNFVHVHVKQIYDYAKSLGTNFDSSVINKRRLAKKLDGFVHDNKYTHIDSVDYSISYYHTSQLLVIFFEKLLHNVDDDNPLYYYASYKAAPSPSPFARILFVREIYLPLVVKSNKPMMFGFEQKLHLIGFSPIISKGINGEERHYYVCYYANIGHVGFVQGTIIDDSSMDDYFDSYTKDGTLADYEISNFKIVDGLEIITFEIETELLHRMFISKKRMLIEKMKKEIRRK